ncbi:MAG: helix-turn-helix transcriptional regulator [Nitrososphaerota archaeon]|nr:helix-turn-helix transcriptional regulator [Nitrososphaerota archaeon]
MNSAKVRHSVPSEKLEGPALLTDFSRFYILTLLYEGGKHGYEIMTSIESRLGRKASPGLVYPFLKLLQGHGYVTFRSSSVGNKQRKVYSLTPSGKAFCDRLFSQFTNMVSGAIEPTLQVCAHCGCRVFRDAYTQEIDGRRLAFCCRYCAKSYATEMRAAG